MYKINEGDYEEGFNPPRITAYKPNLEYIEAVMDQIPHSASVTRENKAEMTKELLAGNKVTATLAGPGGKQTVQMQVGSQGTMRYYDSNNKPVQYKEIREKLDTPKKLGQKQGQTVKLDKKVRKPRIHRSTN